MTLTNESKSRVMLWLFILALCLASFLCGRVARADTYQVEGGWGPTFDLPHGTQFVTGTEISIVANWLGGTLAGWIYIADPQDGLMGLNQQILSYPAGFTIDPTLYAEQQWPFDVWAYMPAGVDLAHPIATQQASLAITTPEPPTWMLVLAAGAILCLKKLWTS